MPPLETADLHQKAVLWPFNGSYDNNGQPNVGTAVEIDTRWEKAASEATAPDGTPIAKPITVFVDRVIAVHSQMWLGELDDLPDDLTDEELYRVVGNDEIPDLRNKNFQRTVSLVLI